ncbi:MAG: alanine:cation symporter family protein [Clostridia bacterium]|nr:alanine:cation symporter family protein [Clostridia bacterium]
MSVFLLIPILVGGVGLFLLIKLRAFFLLHPIKCLKDMARAIRRSSNLSSFTLALSGTLGVGNIIGVASAIIIGGAGSLFWLLASALFSSVIKYSEAALTHGGRGMQDVIKTSFGRAGAFFSQLYMLLCIPLAFSMGASLQAKSISGALCDSLETSPIVVLLLVLIFAIPLMSGNSEKSRNVSAKLVPFATIVYISLCFAVIFVNFERLPETFLNIISSAFSLRSVGGGALGFAMLVALKEGFSCGILSNEAGAGTSSFAHALLTDTTPRESGLFGVAEVFFDTVLICPLTGLAILSSPTDPTAYTSAMRLVSDAFASSLGAPVRVILAVAVFVFAISTVLCWYYYGALAFGSLSRHSLPFSICFLLSLTIGIFSSDTLVIILSDVCLLLMSLPTLAAIIKSSDRLIVLSELDRYKSTKRKKRIKAVLFSISVLPKALISRLRSRPRASTRSQARSHRPHE